MSINTKGILADAFMELCRTMPMEDVTARDIAERCGVSRQTFYNHFQDKQAVVEWIWTSNFDDPMVEFYDYDAWTEKATKVMQENWWFFQKALTATDFWAWHENWMFQNMCRYIVTNYGATRLTDEIRHRLRTWLAGTCRAFPELVSPKGQMTAPVIGMLNRSSMPSVLFEFFPVREVTPPTPRNWKFQRIANSPPHRWLHLYGGPSLSPV